MSSHAFSRVSIFFLLVNISLAALLAYIVCFSDEYLVQGADLKAARFSGLVPLEDSELAKISAHGLIFPTDLLSQVNDDEMAVMYERLQSIMSELNLLDSDIQVSGVSYGNTMTVKGAQEAKTYPIPDHIEQIVFENIRIRKMGDDGVPSSIGSVTIKNINFQDSNIVVTLD